MLLKTYLQRGFDFLKKVSFQVLFTYKASFTKKNVEQVAKVKRKFQKYNIQQFYCGALVLA